MVLSRLGNGERIASGSAILLVGLIGVGCGGSAPAEKGSQASQGRNERILEWKVLAIIPPRTLRVGADSGYCAGYPRPTIGSPQIRYGGLDVYIELEAIAGKEPSKGDPCLGIRLYLERTISLDSDLSLAKVYDSGVDPPELRWPTG